MYRVVPRRSGMISRVDVEHKHSVAGGEMFAGWHGRWRRGDVMLLVGGLLGRGVCGGRGRGRGAHGREVAVVAQVEGAARRRPRQRRAQLGRALRICGTHERDYRPHPSLHSLHTSIDTVRFELYVLTGRVAASVGLRRYSSSADTEY